MKLDELEKLAKAATPGPRKKFVSTIRKNFDLCFLISENPEIILKLIAVAKAAMSVVDEYSPMSKEWGTMDILDNALNELERGE